MSEGPRENRRQLFQFLVLGVMTVLVDLAVYRLLVALQWPIGPSKAISFLTGAAFAYVANRRVTFDNAKGGVTTLSRFAVVYAVNLVMNVAVNHCVLFVAGQTETTLILAFLVATAVSATLNFLGMKYWVFYKGGPEKRV